MPTTNPRIAITLNPHRYDLLKRMAGLQGVSMASMVTELLEEFYPVLERVCVALEHAKLAQESSKQGIRESAVSAYQKIIPLTQAANGQLDLLLDAVMGLPVGEVSPTVGARPHGGGRDRNVGEAGAVNPRVVTRGSGSKRHRPLNQVKSSTGKASKGGSPK